MLKPPRISTSTDLFLGTDGLVYVATSALDLAERTGRKVVRVCALTPGESRDVAAALTNTAPELLVGVVHRRRGRKRQE